MSLAAIRAQSAAAASEARLADFLSWLFTRSGCWLSVESGLPLGEKLLCGPPAAKGFIQRDEIPNHVLLRHGILVLKLEQLPLRIEEIQQIGSAIFIELLGQIIEVKGELRMLWPEALLIDGMCAPKERLGFR